VKKKVMHAIVTAAIRAYTTIKPGEIGSFDSKKMSVQTDDPTEISTSLRYSLLPKYDPVIVRITLEPGVPARGDKSDSVGREMNRKTGEEEEYVASLPSTEGKWHVHVTEGVARGQLQCGWLGG
jgi:hypothetical protein